MHLTLLVIGDRMMDEKKGAPSINKFLRYRGRLLKRRLHFVFATYDDVLLGRLPAIATRQLKIMLFFPYAHWNSAIERYDRDDRIYGDHYFGRDYRAFFTRVEKLIAAAYRDKELSYINHPHACILDRDKRGAARLLKEHGIATAKIYAISNLGQLAKVLDTAGGLYIKPRFGAMGKGISFVTKRACWTNFIYRKGKIISRAYDYHWNFVRVSGSRRNALLEQLIRRRFIVEQAIRLPVLGGRKFDFRVYVIYGMIPYLYAKSAPEDTFVTNWSQGGRIEKQHFLKRALPKKKIEEIKELAKQGARALGLNYAGIDILMDEHREKLYFSEAHSFPGYERGFNLMKYLIDRV